MTEMTAGPGLETPKKRGSRVRGAVGAFFGAFLGALLCDLLLLALPGDSGRLTMFGGMLLIGWMACWGYRLLRGFRSMRVAQWTVRIAIVLGQFLALATAYTLESLQRRYGTLRVHADTLYVIFSQSVERLLAWDSLFYLGILVLMELFFCRLSWGGLLKYTEPGWYSDPRRLARIGGGGATFNYPPCWPLPSAGHIPERFEVDKGRLTVEGSSISFRARGKAPRSFSIDEVAGVVLGVSSGYNILYDGENRMLARFAWSRKNALLFGQYLIGRGIPFIDANGTPIPTVPETRERQAVSRQFTVREGKFCLALGWGGVVLFGCGLAAVILFMEGVQRSVCGMGLLFFVGMFTWILLCYYRRRLEVDGEELTYTTSFGRTTRFRASEVGDIVWSINGCKLKDREGKTLARFENNMENSGLLAAYWNEYKRERTE